MESSPASRYPIALALCFAALVACFRLRDHEVAAHGTALLGGFAGNVTEADEAAVDRMGSFLEFDRGKLGIQAELPDPMSVESRIVDPETLAELARGESGEIVISGPQVFKGYWKRPEATAAAFFERDGFRFFRSGDMGRVDEAGYFFMTDRLKRMINASGFKVWPAEVEALMFRHPAIQEACIIATRDDYRGESVKAVVVLRQDHKGKVSEQDIIDWCRAVAVEFW